MELSKCLSYEEFKKNLYVFGSKDGIIKLRDNKNEKTITIPVKKLALINEVLKKKDKINLIHTAFLTKEKVNKLGIKKYRSLELENETIKKMSDEKSEEKQKILNEMNTNLQYELSSLRDSERKLIKNNKKMHEELIKLRSSGKQDNSNYNIEELNNLKEKVMFFQEENLRLSHNLSNSQKKYDIMKEQLTDIENEKSKISEKISELTNSLGKTNLVKNPFKEKKIKDISKSIDF